MKKQILFLLVTVLTLNCYSQISFEKGYFINDANQKINCLIKNIDWRSNPTQFEYKLTENSDSKKITIKKVKEFGIDNISKYVKSTVNIDRSSETINNLSNEKKPKFKEEELFLKVLVEGKATLYQYVDTNLKRYFYNLENSKIQQLIFKSYKINENNVGKNNRFRQQLWNDLKCPNFEMSKIENVKYKKSSLVKFFTEYSECHNNKPTNFKSKQKKDLFNLTIRPRINSASLTIQNTISSYRDTDFGNKVGFGFGLEAEYILPFYKNKWSIAIEPTYQSFKSKKTTKVNNVSGGFIIANIDYSSIELPFSLKHYFFITNNSKIFVNASYVFDISSKSSIEFTRNDGSILNSLSINTRNNLAIGIGYKQIEKFSLEMRYQTKRELLSHNTFWVSNYETISMILGYTLF